MLTFTSEFRHQLYLNFSLINIGEYTFSIVILFEMKIKKKYYTAYELLLINF